MRSKVRSHSPAGRLEIRRLALQIGLLLAFGIIAPGLAAAQPKLGDSVYKKTEPEPPKESSKAKSKKKQAPAQPAPTRSPAGPASARKSPPANALEVTFLAREPQVEVFLNDRSVGVTDDSLQLSRRLAPGDYVLMARNKRQVLIPTRKISVAAERTVFELFEPPKPQPAPQPVKTETPADDARQELARAIEISERVKKILAAYNDPATTDSVTPDDWQFVFKSAQLGEIQGYTAVQIEAQRWYASGQIELSKKEYQNAFTAFTKAMEFMPASPLPYIGLGDTYYANGKFSDAFKAYARATQLDPKLAFGHKRIGDAQRQLGKSKEAIAAYRTAVQLGYRTVETRYWLGTLMLDSKQPEEAIEVLEDVAKEMPRAEVFIAIGSGYEKLRRDVSAIDAYQRAIAVDPDSAVAYYRLADVYLNQREYPKAKDAYEKALSLDPDGKTVNRTDIQKKIRELPAKGSR